VRSEIVDARKGDSGERGLPACSCRQLAGNICYGARLNVPPEHLGKLPR